MTTRFCLICIFLCVTCSINAQNVAPQGVARQDVARYWLARADSLVAGGQSFEAGIAYERVLFEQPDSLLYGQALTGKVNALKQQGRFSVAVQTLNSELTRNFPDSLLLALRQDQITCAYLAGQFENALSLLDRLPYLHPDRPTETPLTRAIRVLSLNELQRWPEAAVAYRQILVQAGVDTTQTPYQQLPRLKSLEKAERLATFLPGGGQFYAGKPGEAILSLLIQVGGLYFGVTNFLAGYYLSAWGIGAATFGSFHWGGIRRSEVLVKQYNAQQTQRFNTVVKEQLLKQAGQ